VISHLSTFPARNCSVLDMRSGSLNVPQQPIPLRSVAVPSKALVLVARRSVRVVLRDALTQITLDDFFRTSAKQGPLTDQPVNALSDNVRLSAKAIAKGADRREVVTA
jgi:hypothetical protein